MALVVKDRVKETTTTSGTGSLTLAGAVDGFQAFSAALSDGDTTYYAIYESSTDAWEVGLGTFTASGTTLARTTVLSSSNSGSAINLSGSGADVFITQPAEKAAYFDASGDLALNQDPTAALQAATKQYVDSIAAAGIHYHTPVRVEKEGNLTVTYDNGSSGVGATLTNAGTQEALVIDGVTMVADDRVLVYEQTDATQNGIYTVTNVGSGSTNWVMTRATDADSYGPSDPDSLGQGDAFFVQEGAAGAGETYVMNTEGTITFGTTDITFVQFSSAQIYSAGAGLTLTGVTFAAGAGTGVTVNANDIAIGQSVGTGDNVVFNQVTAALVGNASTATTLETARDITLTGAVTGTTSFDGSGNVSITTTATSDPTITLGGDLSGSATLTNLGNATLTATINANSVALGTDTTGNYIEAISAGTAIDVSGSGSEGATATVNLDLSELTTSTTNSDGDYFVVVDTSNAQRKLTKGNINISEFNNDAGFTTNVGDITGVTAGSYLTGGGTSGAVTLNVDATSSNTASKVVARDASGNFSAGTITATGVSVTGVVDVDLVDATGGVTFDPPGAGTDTATDVAIAIPRGNRIVGYHDGYIRTLLDYNTSGTIEIGQNSTSLVSDISLRPGSTGSVILYEGGSTKLATTSTGIDVTGEITADGLTVDGASTGEVRIKAADNAATTFPLVIENSADSLDLGLGAYGLDNTIGVSQGSDFTMNVGRDIIMKSDDKTYFKMGTGGDISFYEDTGTTAKFFWDASAESLGIGTSSPENTNKLDVVADGADKRIAIRTQNTSGGAAVEAQVNNYWSGATYRGTALVQYDSAATGTTVGLSNANLGALRFQNGSSGLIYTNGGTPLVFGTASSERMRIDSSGNLLVGTTSGSDPLTVSGVTLSDAVQEGYTSLSGTTPSIDADTAGSFALSTSGNTTFTFSSVTSGRSVGFVLKITAGGTHTITWPASVDWAGATAPDAPASGETDVLVFYTVDGGTTWYGALAIDAAG